MNADANLADADSARRRYEQAQQEISDLRTLADQRPVQGEGWQTRMNNALREWLDVQTLDRPR